MLGLVIGALAIRSQGIYFAMITLALAQMIYFFCLQATFTGGEDGIQAVPRGTLLGVLDLRQHARRSTSSVLAIFLARLPHHLPRHPLAVRPGAQGHPRERAARDLARLPRRPLQADRLRAVGDARRAWPARTKAIVFQLASLTDVHWTMSGEVVLMTLLGGLGTVFGPVVGAFIVIALENYLAQLGAWVTSCRAPSSSSAC